MRHLESDHCGMFTGVDIGGYRERFRQVRHQFPEVVLPSVILSDGSRGEIAGNVTNPKSHCIFPNLRTLLIELKSV